MVVLGLRKPQLAEDAVHVLRDGPVRHPQATCDTGVRSALGHQRQDLSLTRSQLLEWVVDPTRSNEGLDKRRIDGGATPRDPLEGFEKLAHVRNAALQEVAASVTTRQELRGVLHLDVGREDEDPNIWKLLPDRAGGLETLRRVRRWHPNIHEHQVGCLLADEVQQAPSISGLPHDLEARALEQAHEPFSEEHVVVRHDDPSRATFGFFVLARRVGRAHSGSIRQTSCQAQRATVRVPAQRANWAR